MRAIFFLTLVCMAVFTETVTLGETFRQRQDRLRDEARKREFNNGWASTQKRIRKSEEDDKRAKKMARSKNRSAAKPEIIEEDVYTSNDLEGENSKAKHAPLNEESALPKKQRKTERQKESQETSKEKGTLMLVQDKEYSQTSPKNDFLLMFKRSSDNKFFKVNRFYSGVIRRMAYENLDKEMEFKNLSYELDKVKFSLDSFEPIAIPKQAGPLVEANSWKTSDKDTLAVQDAVIALISDARNNCKKLGWNGEPIPTEGERAPSCTVINTLTGSNPFSAHCGGIYRCTAAK